MNERDKFLTEYFGECWHEDPRPSGGLGRCVKCRILFTQYLNQNLSSWQGFGWLWDKCKEQKWWEEFQWILIDINPRWKYIHPDRFADAVYVFLKEREK